MGTVDQLILKGAQVLSLGRHSPGHDGKEDGMEESGGRIVMVWFRAFGFKIGIGRSENMSVWKDPSTRYVGRNAPIPGPVG